MPPSPSQKDQHQIAQAPNIQYENNSTASLPANQPASNQHQGVVEMSPDKRYIRFDVETMSTFNHIQSSYKAFDTKNGIEVAWHKINLNSLEKSEQDRISQCVKVVKKIQSKYVIEYLGSWNSKDNTLNIITTHLETLREFISKVKTLRLDMLRILSLLLLIICLCRWKIVKKWCRRILKGLHLLHSFDPEIVHRNLTCSHIYIDGGVGTINIGEHDIGISLFLSLQIL